MKDRRYKAIKSLIETKNIQSLGDVFTIIPLSVVKDDMGINYNTLRNRINRSELLTLKDIELLAALFEVNATEIFKLAENDFIKQKKSNAKK